MSGTGKKRGGHERILWALLLGGLAGIFAQALLPGGASNEGLKWVVANIMDPVGGIFLAMIFMVVVPLLVSALVLGVADIGDALKVGRIGAKAMGMTIVLSGLAVCLGLVAVNIVQPGVGLPEEKIVQLEESLRDEATSRGTVKDDTGADPPVLGIVPRNPFLEMTRALSGGILPLMFFALVFGIALANIEPERGVQLKNWFESLFLVSQKMIEYAMKLAPFGVFALVFKTGAVLGLDVFVLLAKYAILVLVVLAFHLTVVYSLALKFIAKRSPLVFFRQVKEVILTAFATSSSNATLPTALRVSEEEVGVPRDIGSFVLTVGATANQNGTALFEGITIIFLCQLFGVDLTLGQQFWVMGMAILAGVGTAGVPGGAWPMIGSIIGKLGVDVSAIGIVLGIDRILDMSRTVLNVVGDMTIAACVATLEGRGSEVPEEAAG
ncbi:MAG: dicarboxylate/amino acid:cation symporter [Fimbriimonadaceae bacterium]|nr:dicarboxylate/amino acid:cation symporter [Fimbriimonadaceae bacterium]